MWDLMHTVPDRAPPSKPEPAEGAMSELRDWTTLLVGGAGGVGKSSVSYRTAHHHGVGITEVDDFQVILEGMTTPDQYPVLHFFRTRPKEWGRMNEEQLLAHAREYAEVMTRALELVIANHLHSGVPIILEGDFILPSLAAQESYGGVPAAGHAQALFLFEDNEEQIGRNFVARDGQIQQKRARASWRYSEWLRAEAKRLGVPTVASRPWDTIFERANAALE